MTDLAASPPAPLVTNEELLTMMRTGGANDAVMIAARMRAGMTACGCVAALGGIFGGYKITHENAKIQVSAKVVLDDGLWGHVVLMEFQ